MPEYIADEDKIAFIEEMETEKDKKLYLPEYLNVQDISFEIVLEY